MNKYKNAYSSQKCAAKKRGVDFTKYARERSIDVDGEAEIILFMLQKRRAETTMAEVDTLPALTGARVLEHMMTRAIAVDDPFSTRSTSLATPTVGASANLGDSPT